jgi:GMP synthase-like glutamine amidotransferase
LRAEKQLIGEFVRADRPFWGVCLGAQLLAASLGARVYEGAAPEVGLLAIDLEHEGMLDPVFSALPKRLLTLQWHSDTFDLPQGAVLLASSASYRHQAFRWRRAYGLQFHLEVSPRAVREWGDIRAYAEALESVLGAGALPRLLGELGREHQAMRSNALVLFRRWLDLDVVVRPRAAMKGVEL